ncbi:MAG: 30S ribosomal protein S3, partial [Spirochaetales bacterium]|nr:30S ribosomal protein S3 [Spirochaetales bacterium]
SKKISMKVKEIKKPEVEAQLIAMNVARQLQGRSAFKRVLKMSVMNAMKGGAQGVKVKISGRLAGADMAREQEHKAGRIPLHTLRADIDYGFAEANTTYGIIGVKVWVFKGEVFSKETRQDAGAVLKKKPQRERGAKKDA